MNNPHVFYQSFYLFVMLTTCSNDLFIRFNKIAVKFHKIGVINCFNRCMCFISRMSFNQPLVVTHLTTDLVYYHTCAAQQDTCSSYSSSPRTKEKPIICIKVNAAEVILAPRMIPNHPFCTFAGR